MPYEVYLPESHRSYVFRDSDEYREALDWFRASSEAELVRFCASMGLDLDGVPEWPFEVMAARAESKRAKPLGPARKSVTIPETT